MCSDRLNLKSSCPTADGIWTQQTWNVEPSLNDTCLRDPQILMGTSNTKFLSVSVFVPEL